LNIATNPYHNTRIAPTPSGFLHVGNVLSFAVTSALAKKSGAKVLLRIDDLDRARINDRYLQDIFDTLHFLGIPWDRGPQNVRHFQDHWSQIHRMNLYNAAIRKLCDKGIVFACTCSRQQIRTSKPCACFKQKIPLEAENANLRLMTGAKKLQVKSYNGGVICATLPAEMENFIIRRKDGIPSYQLASVVDDLYYNIDLVVRGEDLWSSTLAQHELASALDENKFHEITFYHHPLLMEESGKKLSKSDGATSIHYLRENGQHPPDIYTLIARMIGSHENINSLDDLIHVINFTFNMES
jgi:glutamyl/glutaminyl-tRNA synthetase